MWWRSWRTPVAIVAAHTGVTDGNAAVQAWMPLPRAAISASAGAWPVEIARSTISGFAPSMTARTSFTGGSAGPRTSPDRACAIR